MSSVYIPVMITVALDLTDRFKFMQQSNSRFVKIAEIHDIYDAATIKNHLESSGILCHFQGYYHRHLLYFFGPYIEISLLVSTEHEKASIEFINRYDSKLLSKIKK